MAAFRSIPIFNSRVRLRFSVFIYIMWMLSDLVMAEDHLLDIQGGQAEAHYSMSNFIEKCFLDVAIFTNRLAIAFDEDAAPYRIYVDDYKYAGLSSDFEVYQIPLNSGNIVRFMRGNSTVTFKSLGSSTEGVTYLVRYGSTSSQIIFNLFGTVLPKEKGEFRISDEIGMIETYHKGSWHTNLINEGKVYLLDVAKQEETPALKQNLDKMFNAVSNRAIGKGKTDVKSRGQSVNQPLKNGKTAILTLIIMLVVTPLFILGVLMVKRKGQSESAD